ncbi:hypothetical protein APICC_04903 [Apis cerana cerana]|uniref:Uncharacterized protein n=1 Tax=Apis cerana cerana TaxID=94128 RepID=A0A2A3E2M7_APICC|nr:hypothetical protein APICC_04903 [Apis cerana cerana]
MFWKEPDALLGWSKGSRFVLIVGTITVDRGYDSRGEEESLKRMKNISQRSVNHLKYVEHIIFDEISLLCGQMTSRGTNNILYWTICGKEQYEKPGGCSFGLSYFLAIHSLVIAFF